MARDRDFTRSIFVMGLRKRSGIVVLDTDVIVGADVVASNDGTYEYTRGPEKLDIRHSTIPAGVGLVTGAPVAGIDTAFNRRQYSSADLATGQDHYRQWRSPG